MEIPSSSPVYTPLSERIEKHLKPEDYDLPHIELFAKKQPSIDQLSSNARDTNNDRPSSQSCPGFDNNGSATEIETDMEMDSSLPDSPEMDKTYVADTYAEEPLNPYGYATSEPPQANRESDKHSKNRSKNHSNEHENLSMDDYPSMKTNEPKTMHEDEHYNNDSDDNETTILSDDDQEEPQEEPQSEQEVKVEDVHRNSVIGEDIMSDDDAETMMSQTQETVDPRKNTQNYLEEFLTESLLESLPLPPEKKQGLRGYCK